MMILSVTSEGVYNYPSFCLQTLKLFLTSDILFFGVCFFGVLGFLIGCLFFGGCSFLGDVFCSIFFNYICDLFLSKSLLVSQQDKDFFRCKYFLELHTKN